MQWNIHEIVFAWVHALAQHSLFKKCHVRFCNYWTLNLEKKNVFSSHQATSFHVSFCIYCLVSFALQICNFNHLWFDRFSIPDNDWQPQTKEDVLRHFAFLLNITLIRVSIFFLVSLDSRYILAHYSRGELYILHFLKVPRKSWKI